MALPDKVKSSSGLTFNSAKQGREYLRLCLTLTDRVAQAGLDEYSLIV